MNENEKVVPLIGFGSMDEAGTFKAHLESEGISCFVRNEITSNMFGIASAGEITLEVFESDLPESRRIIEEGGYLTKSDQILEDTQKDSINRLKRFSYLSKPALFLLYGLMAIVICNLLLAVTALFYYFFLQ